jgi:hypothetical protein
MSDFLTSIRQLLPGAWALRDGHALAFGHIAAADLPECNERRCNEHRLIRAGTGVADRTVVCEKNASDAWGWRDKGDAYLAATFQPAGVYPPTGTVSAFAGITTPADWFSLLKNSATAASETSCSPDVGDFKNQSFSNLGTLIWGCFRFDHRFAFFNSCSWPCGPRPGHENGRPSPAAAPTG